MGRGRCARGSSGWTRRGFLIGGFLTDPHPAYHSASLPGQTPGPSAGCFAISRWERETFGQSGGGVRRSTLSGEVKLCCEMFQLLLEKTKLPTLYRDTQQPENTVVCGIQEKLKPISFQTRNKNTVEKINNPRNDDSYLQDTYKSRVTPRIN